MTDGAAVVAAFADRLRWAGVPVTPDRAARFASACERARPCRTDELYWLGRVTLVSDRAHLGAYDQVFAEVFRGLADVADARSGDGRPPAPFVEPGRARRAETSTPPRAVRHGAGATAMAAGMSASETPDDTRAAAPSGASRSELLRTRDFGTCSVAELAELRALVGLLQVAPPRRRSRRRRRHVRGDTIDLRASLRRAHRTGGQLADLRRRGPTVRQRRVVLLADVSGSMEPYARAYLYLLHGAVRALRAETFVFATRLTRITKRLADAHPERALQSAMGEVGDWSGGTRIGEALRAFNDRWGRRGLAHGAVVVIVSDGWEGDDPELVAEQMERLARMAHRIVWVNPRVQHPEYRPLAGGMAAALPHVDALVSGHSLAALDDVIAAIAAP